MVVEVKQMVEGDIMVVEGVALTIRMDITEVGVVTEDVGGAILLATLTPIGAVALYVALLII